MPQTLLSIIIPTYNMESLLSQCLDSVCLQDLAGLLQVFVVNDGSKDSSLQIANDYKSRFPDIITIIDKENGNYGSCINAALKIVDSKYVKILDADDWFDPDALRNAVTDLMHTDTDLVYSPFVVEHVNSGKKNNKFRTSPWEFTTGQIAEIKLNQNEVNSVFCMHSLMVRTDLLRKIEYRQTEGISYTDMEYVFYPLINANTITILDHLLYHYRVGREGQTVSIEATKKHADNRRIIVERMIDYVANNKPQLRDTDKAFFTVCVASYYWTVLAIKKSTDADLTTLKRIDDNLKVAAPDVYQRLNAIQCIKIKYIKNWRRTGTNRFPYRLYCLLRSIFIDM